MHNKNDNDAASHRDIVFMEHSRGSKFILTWNSLRKSTLEFLFEAIWVNTNHSTYHFVCAGVWVFRKWMQVCRQNYKIKFCLAWLWKLTIFTFIHSRSHAGWYLLNLTGHRRAGEEEEKTFIGEQWMRKIFETNCIQKTLNKSSLHVYPW